ncbi:cytochrome P450 4C1-like [Neodiprion virginianus]|uniref:cytochrome P450 4C1-like n=1 Tax=Neodiprion virginianus TaxID=2961670 RepID=UPI001EE6963A|nr:cytochrome P450 4C1-like [Neodiprion virginianus]
MVCNLGINVRTLDDVSKFEGPPSWPIIGSAHLFIGGGEAIINRQREFEKLYSKPYGMFLGNDVYFVTSNPDQIKVICHNPKTIEKADKFVDLFRPWLGSGLLTGPASIWRVHRKLIQPTFDVQFDDSKLFPRSIRRQGCDIDQPNRESCRLARIRSPEILRDVHVGHNLWDSDGCGL